MRESKNKATCNAIYDHCLNQLHCSVDNSLIIETHHKTYCNQVLKILIDDTLSDYVKTLKLSKLACCPHEMISAKEMKGKAIKVCEVINGDTMTTDMCIQCWRVSLERTSH